MNKENLPSLADHHTHAQDLEFHNEISAMDFNIKVGDHLYPKVSEKRYVEHVLRNNLDTIWLIYEDTSRLISIREAIKKEAPSTLVRGFYFIRDPKTFEQGELINLYQQDLLHGIKIHPVIDNFALLPENFSRVIDIAKKLDVPIIFHSDDRKKSQHLTSPDKQEVLIKAYPDVRFVIGHGGAYANPRLVGDKNTAALSYWEKRPGEKPSELIIKALSLTLKNENVFYEFSITTNKIKAGLIADFVKENSKVAGKILAGSDFPTLNARLDSQLLALSEAGLSTELVIQIAKNRL